MEEGDEDRKAMGADVDAILEKLRGATKENTYWNLSRVIIPSKSLN
jgi:hypothetical protein